MSRNMKILIASGSGGGAHVAVPLALAAKEAGDEVIVISDGVAAGRFEEAGLPLYFKGTPSCTVEPFTLDGLKVLERLRPDVVVATRGGPTYLECCFDRPANDLGVPLVLFEDWWGNHVFCRGRPDLVLSVDKLGAQFARRNTGAKAVVVGNRAVTSARKLAVPASVVRRIEQLKKRFGTVIYFAGGGTETADTIAFLKRCLDRTPPPWVVVPGFHPSFVDLPAPNGVSYGDVWRNLLKEVSGSVVYVDARPGEVLAKTADVTVANWSTALTVAAASGKQAIGFMTEGERAAYHKERNLEEFPLVTMGLCVDIATPCDLLPYLAKRPPKKLADKWLKPYDPAKALVAMRKLVRERRQSVSPDFPSDKPTKQQRNRKERATSRARPCYCEKEGPINA